MGIRMPMVQERLRLGKSLVCISSPLKPIVGVGHCWAFMSILRLSNVLHVSYVHAPVCAIDYLLLVCNNIFVHSI